LHFSEKTGLFLFTQGCKSLKSWSLPLASQSAENLSGFLCRPHFTRQKYLEADSSVEKESRKAGEISLQSVENPKLLPVPSGM
jgi:hypothetical protein